jgi:hypothetical protein
MLIQTSYNHSCSFNSSLDCKGIVSMTILVILIFSLCGGKCNGDILFRKADQLIFVIYRVCTIVNGDRCGTVVKVLCYKSEGRWFDSKWCHRNFSFRSHYGPGFDSASNRNEYQKHFLAVKVAGA